MIWQFAQTELATDTTQVFIESWGVAGALIVLLMGVILYQARKIDRLQKEKDQLQIERLQDVRLFAEKTREPLQELKNFVGTLYDQSNRNSGAR